MQRLVTRLKTSQRGITGIETAIILIAFVIVASVFAYVVLSAGLFSTQEAKESIYSGLDEAKSAVEVKGNIYATMTANVVDSVYFTLATSVGGTAIDFTDTADGDNKVVISYIDDYQIFPTVNWTLTKLNTTGIDNLLDDNELFMITVDLTCVSVTAAPDELPGPYHTFTLEVKPPAGAVLIIERTLPARLDDVINLY